MKHMLATAALFLAACQTAPPPTPDMPWRSVDAKNIVLIELQTGTVTVELAQDAAPRHSNYLRKAVRSGIYDGEFFYRVIEGHVAQGGLEFDARLTDTPTLKFEAERAVPKDGFTPLGSADLFTRSPGHRTGFAVGREGQQEWLMNCTGALGMARDNDPDTGSLEIFFPLAPRRYLDRNYTVFGRVIGGMEHVQRLKRVAPTSEDDTPTFFDAATADARFAERAKRLRGNDIKSIKIAADLPATARPNWEVMDTASAEWDALKESKRDYGSIDAFIVPPPRVLDICSLPVPARLKSEQSAP